LHVLEIISTFEQIRFFSLEQVVCSGSKKRQMGLNPKKVENHCIPYKRCSSFAWWPGYKASLLQITDYLQCGSWEWPCA